MKKLLVAAGLLVVLGAIAALVASNLLGSLVRTGVTTLGPGLTGTTVTLESARLSPLTGAGSLTGLVVGNPPGWQSDHALSLGHVTVDVEPLSLLGDAIVIEEITLRDPRFVYETKLVRSNIKDLLDHIEKSTGGPAPTDPAAADAPARKFIVKRFVLTGAEVTLGVGAAALTLPMPPITLNDLGVREGGITAGQLAGAVMRSVLADIGTATAQAAGRLGAAGGAAATEAIGSAAQKAGEGLKKLLGK